MSEFTPGPWVYEKVHNGPFTRIGTPVAIVGEPTDPHTVGRVSDDMYQSNGKADARLIAAAPDLLAACEAALANMIDMGDTSQNDMKVREQLTTAIKKARGE